MYDPWVVLDLKNFFQDNCRNLIDYMLTVVFLRCDNSSVIVYKDVLLLGDVWESVLRGEVLWYLELSNNSVKKKGTFH